MGILEIFQNGGRIGAEGLVDPRRVSHHGCFTIRAREQLHCERKKFMFDLFIKNEEREYIDSELSNVLISLRIVPSPTTEPDATTQAPEAEIAATATRAGEQRGSGRRDSKNRAQSSTNHMKNTEMQARQQECPRETSGRLCFSRVGPVTACVDRPQTVA